MRRAVHFLVGLGVVLGIFAALFGAGFLFWFLLIKHTVLFFALWVALMLYLGSQRLVAMGESIMTEVKG